MSTNKPEGYAPDMFSEQSRLSQFGARALAIVRRFAPSATWEYEAGKPRLLESLILDAQALGLLLEVRPEGSAPAPYPRTYSPEQARAKKENEVRP